MLISVIDEEVDGTGAIWLPVRARARARALRLPAQRGRRRGASPVGDERFYGVSLGEKGVFRFTLHTDGVAGHASMPNIADNALLKLCAAARADGRPAGPGWDVTPGPAALFSRLDLPLDGEQPRGGARGAAGGAGRSSRRSWRPMLRVTLAPTPRGGGGGDYNVIPAAARIGRRLPRPARDGPRRRCWRAWREVLGEDGYRLEFTEIFPGTASVPASR